MCSYPYVKGHDEWGMELIAAPLLYEATVYYSYILTNKESKINSSSGLKGKFFAFTHPESNTGKLVLTYELAKMNETAETCFPEFIFTGSHDKFIEAIADFFRMFINHNWKSTKSRELA